MTSSLQPPAAPKAEELAHRYAAAFSQAATGMAIVALDGQWLEVNRRLSAITGYSEAELLATSFQAITHPEDLALDLQHVQQLLAGRISDYSIEKRYIRKDGAPTWIQLTTSLARDENERPLFFISVIQPIDDRKELERQTDASRHKLEGFFNQAGTGMAITDLDGRVQDCNDRLCQILGYQRDELQAHTYLTLTHPDHLEENCELVRRMLSGEIREYTLEKRFLRKDGRPVWCLVSAALVRADVDAPFICSVVKDISARKQLEAELQEARYALELRVEERTRELRIAKQQAEEALRVAEAAGQARCEFLATLSHEIRTPLNAVIGFNGLLLDSPLDAEQRHFVELARTAGENLLHLLNDFLDFSKIEAGHLELEPVEFAPAQELEQVLGLVEATAQQKQLSLQLRVDAPPLLHGDVARLRQILLNLLSNAVKFTERGSVTLRCEEMLRLDHTAWLYIEVSDTGIGIDPAMSSRLFQPFSQGDASTTRKYGGTGLGLVICKRLTEAMGGTIGYRSSPGRGSSFWLSLPFRLAEAAKPAPEPPAPATGTPCQGRVLVVEDNPTSQKLTATLLQRIGCRVDVAGNGLEAVEAVQQLPYDLIFMDCDMPVMNGFDATRAIRALDGPAGAAPIVALTASALAGDREKCLDCGMNDFLAKPVRPQALEQMVQAWLGRAGQRD